jgi:hypothetical protein
MQYQTFEYKILSKDQLKQLNTTFDDLQYLKNEKEESKRLEQYKWGLHLKDRFRNNDKLRLSTRMLDPKYNRSQVPAPTWAAITKGQTSIGSGVFYLDPTYIKDAILDQENWNGKMIDIQTFVYSECISELILELEIIAMSLIKGLTRVEDVCDLIAAKATPLLPFYNEIVNRGYIQAKYCLDLTYGCHLNAKCDGKDCKKGYNTWTEGSRWHCLVPGCDFDLCDECCIKNQDQRIEHSNSKHTGTGSFIQIKMLSIENVIADEKIKQKL